MRASAESRICFGYCLITASIGAALEPLLGDQLGEYRCLQDAEPDVEADADQRQAQRERDTPAPGKEMLAGHLTEGEHGEIGEEQSAGDAELRPRRDKAARVITARPFHRHQHRATPFAAD